MLDGQLRWLKFLMWEFCYCGRCHKKPKANVSVQIGTKHVWLCEDCWKDYLDFTSNPRQYWLEGRRHGKL